ncbi:MAG: DmsC/YnfH family molybdoenzyme membrane anchor subunit [Egibacteraceae bacterium]
MHNHLPVRSPPAPAAPAEASCGPGGGCGDAPAPDATVRTLIDEFLAAEAGTAVQRFSRRHDAEQAAEAAAAAGAPPAQDRWYRDLLPATPPGPGQQYAFEVDLDACSGCKACVVACTNLNGLPEGVSFRSTGTLGGAGGDAPAVLRTVTTACHHCADPGCLNGCPANAYEKDALTGVVRHLADQCIGCRYCTLMCPYEVPRYDAEAGIVRKCDLCQDRLADGEAPACVQACPTEAIAIRVVDLDDVDAAADEPWPFASPAPATTRPATRYRSSEDLRDGVSAVDTGALSPAGAHPPLSVMLVLTQFAVGTLAVLVLGGGLLPHLHQLAAVPAAVAALGTAVTGLAASVGHLGRPSQAWRAVLGVGHSWLSREIVAFGAFAPAAAVYSAGLAGVAPLDRAVGWLGPVAVALGLAGVGTSVMVYAVTARRWWSLPRVAARFAATTALGGLATTLAVATVTGAVTGTSAAPVVPPLAVPLTVVAVLVGLAELGLLRHRHGPPSDELARTARLLTRQLGTLCVLRTATLAVGAVLAPWLALRMLTVARTSPTAAAVTAVVGLLALLVAELCERWRFFTASAPDRMPGRLP